MEGCLTRNGQTACRDRNRDLGWFALVRPPMIYPECPCGSSRKFCGKRTPYKRVGGERCPSSAQSPFLIISAAPAFPPYDCFVGGMNTKKLLGTFKMTVYCRACPEHWRGIGSMQRGQPSPLSTLARHQHGRHTGFVLWTEEGNKGTD